MKPALEDPEFKFEGTGESARARLKDYEGQVKVVAYFKPNETAEEIDVAIYYPTEDHEGIRFLRRTLMQSLKVQEERDHD